MKTLTKAPESLERKAAFIHDFREVVSKHQPLTPEAILDVLSNLLGDVAAYYSVPLDLLNRNLEVSYREAMTTLVNVGLKQKDDEPTWTSQKSEKR